MSSDGWYADPGRRHEYRYWDSRGWTALVSDAGIRSTEPLEAPAGPPAGSAAPAEGAPLPPPPSAPRRHTGRTLAWVGAVLLALVGVVGVVAASVSDSGIKETFATDYAALGSRDAGTAADALDAQVAKAKAAYDAYVAAATVVRARHEAVTEKFNEVAQPLDATDRLGILRAQGALPGVIAAYQVSLARERAAAATYYAQLARLRAMTAR